MFTAYLVVTLLTVAVNAYAAAEDLRRTESAVANVTQVGGSTSWLVPLGLVKAAGILGLLLGVAVPWIGIAASSGFVLYFTAAVGAHIRVKWFGPIAVPSAFLALAIGSLVLRLTTL